MTAAAVLRLARRTIHWFGARNLLALGLLFTSFASVTLGLVGAVRGIDSGLGLSLVVVGLLVGWGLAAAPLPGWAGGVLAFVSGLAVVPLRVGRLEARLLVLAQALVRAGWQVLLVPYGGAWPDWPPVAEAARDVWAGCAALAVRVRDWLLGLARGDEAYDPVATVLVWSALLWCVTAWGGWMVRRRGRPLLGVAPAGVLLAVSLSLVDGEIYTLLGLLWAALVLLALVAHDVRVRRWKDANLHIYPILRFYLDL